MSETRKFNRRQFLRLTAAAGATGLLAACAPATTPQPAPKPAAPAAQPTTSQALPTVAVPESSKVQTVSGDTSVTGKVVFSTWGGDKEVATNKAIIEQFNATYTKAQGELLHIPTNYNDKVLTMFASGTPPDVLYVNGADISGYLSKNAILDLSEQFKAYPVLMDDSVYVTRFIKEATMLQGHNFGTANGTNGYVLYYNKTMFDKEGIKHPENWTWDDYLEAAKKLTKREGDKVIQYGSTAGFAYQNLEVLARSQGGDLFPSHVMPEKSLFDSQEVIWGLQFVQDLVYKHKVAPTPAEAQAMQLSPWETGKVAMEIGHSFAIEHRSLIKDWQWDIAHVPQGKKKGGSYSGGVYLVAKAGKSPKAAWEFAKWFMLDQAQGIFALDGLEAPLMRKWRTSEKHLKFSGAPAHHIVRAELLDYATDRGAHHPKFNEIISKGYTPETDKLMLNQQSAEQTAKNIAKVANDLLAEVTSLPIG